MGFSRQEYWSGFPFPPALSMKALEDVAAKEIEEEVFEIPEAEEVTTSLGALLSKFKL